MKLYPIILTIFILTAVLAIFLFVTELKAVSTSDVPVRIIPTYRSDGTVNFQVLTVTNHGQYSTRNIGAVWVTTESGTFVKTLQRWGNSYLQYLTKWHSFTATGNTTGAVTGATMSNHSLHNLNWNCRNTSSVEVPDGNYKIWVEFTESNGTGPFTSVTFTKGASAQSVTPANQTYFHNLLLNFTPTIVVGPPTNLQSSVTLPNTVNLTWSAPASTSGLTSYKVYRDGMMITTVTAPMTSTSDMCMPGDHNYFVTALFGATESAASNTVSVTITANQDGTQTPNITTLNGNYPNPFNPETNISFSLAENQYAQLSIFNFRGQKVRELTKGNMASGLHVVSWNGTDDHGNKVASGFYLYKLETNNKTLIKKMIMLK
jgi:flagellar hook assembly protein FlgD